MALTRRQPLASLGKQVDLRSGSSRHRRTGNQPDGNRFRRARRRTAPSWLSSALIEGTATGRAPARRLASKGSPRHPPGGKAAIRTSARSFDIEAAEQSRRIKPSARAGGAAHRRDSRDSQPIFVAHKNRSVRPGSITPLPKMKTSNVKVRCVVNS